MLDVEKALLNAIAREPGEDLHRLAYADWLTEHGDPNRAELIRVQCGLERGVDWQTGKKATNARVKKLKECEKELIEGMLTFKEGEWSGVREFATMPEIAAHRDFISFRRGMIDSLHLSFTSITHLPPGLHVGGDLNIYRTGITTLPPDLHVGGDLNLRLTPITNLPADLHVAGDLNLEGTPITADAAQRILTMQNLSRQAKVTGLQSAGYPALANEADRLPESNSGPGSPPRP